ncbi:MAG: sarcosine oxidase subunit gamma [Rhodospirillales bacterium]|nr:sarcosine oxidase subunit gamma [Rhodospirillales bacterium]
MLNSKTIFTPKKTTPLDGLISVPGAVKITEKNFVGKVNIRGNSDNATFANAAKEVLGTSLPVIPNTVLQSSKYTVFWLGPDEWLINSPEDTQAELVAELQDAFEGQHSAVTDVTDYYVVIEIRGKQSRDILARGCPLDLHDRTFKTGRCAQSFFANAPIMLHQVDDGAYDIQVRRTYAQYLWEYLNQSIRQLAS